MYRFHINSTEIQKINTKSLVFKNRLYIYFMKKVTKKTSVSFSLTEAGTARFEKFVEENCIDKSKLVEKLILKHINK